MASAGGFPLPLVSVGVAAAIEGGGAVGLGGIGVLVTVGDGTGVWVSVGTAVNTVFTLASTVASMSGVGSDALLHATSTMSAGSSSMALSFISCPSCT